MSLEMAHKVIVPQKKIISRSFLNSRTLIVIITIRHKHWGRYLGRYSVGTSTGTG